MMFYAVASWLVLALAIIAVALIAKSETPFFGKLSFAGFIFLGLIMPRIHWYVLSRRMTPTRNLLRMLDNFSPIFDVVAMLLLLAFAFAVAGRFRNAASLGSKTSPTPNSPLPNRFRGHVWDTKLTPTAKHVVLRRREWAYLIDHAPILLYFAAYGIVIGISNDRGIHQFMTALGLVAGAWWFFYVPAKDASDGQSIGKYFADSRVVDFTTGTPIGMKQSLIRNIPLIIPGFAVVEFFVAMVRHDRRRIGDLLAGSIVVKGKPQFVDGVEVSTEAVVVEEPTKHPLD